MRLARNYHLKVFNVTSLLGVLTLISFLYLFLSFFFNNLCLQYFLFKATITVTAAKTDEYREAVKKIALTVNKKPQTISLASAKITKTIGDKAFNLGAKANGTLSYSLTPSSLCVREYIGCSDP